MGMRSGTSFKKRQKEIARMEKQRDKVAKRLQRKTEKAIGGPVDDMGEPVGDLSEPHAAEEQAGEEQSEVGVDHPVSGDDASR
jgi:hypothetical protein